MTFAVLISTEKCHFPSDMQSRNLTMNYLLPSYYLLSVSFLNNAHNTFYHALSAQMLHVFFLRFLWVLSFYHLVFVQIIFSSV